MSGLSAVIDAHRMDILGCCKCGNRVRDIDWLDHVAAAILAHLRAVAADEGVRERVNAALWKALVSSSATDDPLDATLTAFLDHLDHGRAGDAGEGSWL